MALIAFAARRLIEDDTLVPGYVYHDPDDESLPAAPDGSRASGWNLLVGDETEDELADAKSLIMPELGWLAQRYPAFGELVHAGFRARQYEWNPTFGSYADTGPVESELDEV
jgi:hypothetical protein